MMAGNAVKPSEVRRRLGVSEKTLKKLPLNRTDVSPPGARRPTWRYDEDEVEAYRRSRTVKPGYKADEPEGAVDG